MQTPGTNHESIWLTLAPMLEDAMARLPEKDRTVILLRYFEQQNLRTVGESLGLSDDAAQKRVARALDRLRQFLCQQGMTIPCAALAAVVAQESTAAMIPAGTVEKTALFAFSGSTLTTSASTLTFTTLVAMTTSKLATLGVAAAAALTIGTVVVWNTVTAKQHSTDFQHQPPITEARQSRVSLSVAPANVAARQDKRAGSAQKTTATREPASSMPKNPPPIPYPPSVKEAFVNHPMTKSAERRVNIGKATCKKILDQRSASYRLMMNEWTLLSRGSTTEEKREAAVLAKTIRAEEVSLKQLKDRLESKLQDDVIKTRKYIMALIAEETTHPAANTQIPKSAPLEDAEQKQQKAAMTLFEDQDFRQAEHNLLPLLQVGTQEERSTVAWHLMLCQMAQGKYDDSSLAKHFSNMGTTSIAVSHLMQAAESIQQGSWPDAQIWIDQAWENAPREEVTSMAASLVKMGWAEQDQEGRPRLIPPDKE